MKHPHIQIAAVAILLAVVTSSNALAQTSVPTNPGFAFPVFSSIYEDEPVSRAKDQMRILEESRSGAAERATPLEDTGNRCDAPLRDLNRLIRSNPKSAIKDILRILEKHPHCACEIMKGAIEELHADSEQIAKILESIVLSHPELAETSARCAAAAAPDAVDAINGVLSTHKMARISLPSNPVAKTYAQGTPLRPVILPKPVEVPAVTPVD